MRLSQAAAVGAILGLTLILPACGGESTQGPGEVEAAPVHATRDGACRRQLRPLLASLGTLRTDLAVGLSYDGYIGELHAARKAYREVQAQRLRLGCLVAAGAPAERALNRYADAANAWGRCLATAACETASIEPRLQRKWARASRLLSAARAGV